MGPLLNDVLGPSFKKLLGLEEVGMERLKDAPLGRVLSDSSPPSANVTIEDSIKEGRKVDLGMRETEVQKNFTRLYEKYKDNEEALKDITDLEESIFSTYLTKPVKKSM